MNDNKLTEIAFGLMQKYGEDSVEERHLNQDWNFEKISQCKYKFSMHRHPSIGPSQDRKNGLVAFVEVKNNYILDTEKMDVEFTGREFIRAEIDYESMAEIDKENTVDIYSIEIEEIETREKAVEFAKNEAEGMAWEAGLEDEISTLEEEFSEFSFDWDLYLSTVKNTFINLLLEKWDNKGAE